MTTNKTKRAPAPSARVPSTLIHDDTVSAQAVRLYLILALIADRKTMTAQLSQRALGAAAGIRSLPTVRKYLRELSESGWITWQNQTGTDGGQLMNAYTIRGK